MKRILSRLIRTISLKNPQTVRVCSLVGVGGISLLLYKQHYVNKAKIAICETKLNKDNIQLEKGSREERFLEFASVECNGLVLMTPADFLESVTQQQPRHHKARFTISEKDAQLRVRNTLSKRYGSPKFFRTLDKEGLITYTEYLFLLCVLTKPKSGFKIAFNMFDTDLNEQVDKSEFMVMERTMQLKKTEVLDKLKSATDPTKISESWFLLKLLNKLIIGEVNPMKDDNTNQDTPDEVSLHSLHHSPPEFNTTMLLHFFGKNGRDKLSFNDFAKFMDNLQSEVLEIEFVEFSKGLKTISESEFAKILLRCTTVDQDRHDEYIRRVVKKIKMEKGITFDDFKTFFQFLNNLEDFILAMRMYTLADRAISKAEFHQAVKACTNTTLSKQLVKTIFYMFDEDGDGQLSYKEFIQIMKNRLNRGFTTSPSSMSLWRKYRHCVSDTLYNNY